MFISIFCGDAEGDGLVWGIFIPGMFICCGEGLDVGGVLVAGIFIPGIFIPGMLPIPGFIVERDRPLLRRCFVRWVLDIFMPGIFIPDMFAILFFFAAGFLLRVVLFFGELVLPIFIPGMFVISCGAAEEIRPVDKMAIMITAKREILLNSMPPPVYSHTLPALRDFSWRNCADLCLHSIDRFDLTRDLNTEGADKNVQGSA